MSINHFSTDLPDTRWWTPPPPPPPQQQTQIMEPSPQSPLISQVLYRHHQLGKSPFNFNLNQNDDESHSDDRDCRQNDDALVENSNNKIATELRDSINIMTQKEAMFEKPLTPSDVGKLNRLVIPKQHAEKYFPIGGTGNNGVSGGESVEKGVLLSFEDESGISWRFRYSYWNSSQSYVLTKGWSRFVKEKRLDAGDVVMFERQVNDNERFFIGWRRRNAVQQTLGEVAVSAGGGGWAPMAYAANPPPPPTTMQQYTAATAGLGAGAGNMQNQTRGSGNSKTVRLFGVNLECQSDEVDGSSQAQAHYHHHSTPHLQNHMDINFSRDVNQMRFHQG